MNKWLGTICCVGMLSVPTAILAQTPATKTLDDVWQAQVDNTTDINNHVTATMQSYLDWATNREEVQAPGADMANAAAAAMASHYNDSGAFYKADVQSAVNESMQIGLFGEVLGTSFDDVTNQEVDNPAAEVANRYNMAEILQSNNVSQAQLNDLLQAMTNPGRIDPGSFKNEMDLAGADNEEAAALDQLTNQMLLSAATSALSEISAKRYPSSDGGMSLMALLEQESERRFKSTDWNNKVTDVTEDGDNVLSTEALLRELVQMEALRAYLQYHQYRSSEQTNALLSAMIAQNAKTARLLAALVPDPELIEELKKAGEAAAKAAEDLDKASQNINVDG